MKPRQTLVVGSGAGGMTLALLLARAGRSVTLIENQPSVGGYLRRFTRDGIRFDTGYHYSGGFDGVMRQMAQVLGIADLVAAEPIDNRIVLRESGHDILLPAGCTPREAGEIFASHFPGEARGLLRFEDARCEIWRTTPMCDLTDLTPPEEYERIQMARQYGFEKRDRGAGRPTKRDRREIEEFKYK